MEALNDRREPHDSGDRVPRFTWYDHRGTKEWVQYEFPAVRQVSAVEVYWFDDARGKGNCRVPQSWRLLYKDGDTWKPVAGASSYGRRAGQVQPGGIYARGRPAACGSRSS